MVQLHTICPSYVKVFKLFPQGDHNGTVACKGYFDAIEEFLGKYVFAKV